jgi:LysR family transcriptional regulator for bpeEF and oprC
MQEDQIKTLMTLVVVGRTGSFAAAARELNTTRATVSRIIGEAERNLKTRLCHRTTRQVVLTDSAKTLIREVERPLEHIAAALSSLSEDEGRLQGLIRVSVSHGFGRHYISPLVASFMRSHPQVRIQLRMRDSIDDLVGQAIDVAIRIGGLPDSNLIARSLGGLRVALVATPAVIGDNFPRDLVDLDQLPLIAYRPVSMREPRAWTFERDGVQQVYKVRNGQVDVDSIEGAADFARAGLGVVMLPYHLIADDIRSGKLMELLPDYRCVGPDIHICYTSRELIPPRVRTLIDFLMLELSKQTL